MEKVAIITKANVLVEQMLYLKKDVLLLADVFWIFRNALLKYYKLNRAQFYTTAELTWKVLLMKGFR